MLPSTHKAKAIKVLPLPMAARARQVSERLDYRLAAGSAITARAAVTEGHPGDEFLVALAHELKARFSIGHATIQVDVNKNIACALDPDHVV